MYKFGIQHDDSCRQPASHDTLVLFRITGLEKHQAPVFTVTLVFHFIDLFSYITKNPLASSWVMYINASLCWFDKEPTPDKCTVHRLSWGCSSCTFPPVFARSPLTLPSLCSCAFVYHVLFAHIYSCSKRDAHALWKKSAFGEGGVHFSVTVLILVERRT